MPGPSSFPAFGSMGKILAGDLTATGGGTTTPGINNLSGSTTFGNGGGLKNFLSGAGNLLNTAVNTAGAAMGANPGYALSMGLGAVKNVAANIKQKQANAMFPSAEDPELRMLANDWRRRKRAFQTGTAMGAELANQRALAKQGVNATFRAGGGAAGLNRMQQLLGQAMLGNKQAGMQGEMFYADKYGDVVNTLAQTRLQKALAKYSQVQADAKQLKTDANRMTNLGIAGLINPGQVAETPVDLAGAFNNSKNYMNYGDVSSSTTETTG